MACRTIHLPRAAAVWRGGAARRNCDSRAISTGWWKNFKKELKEELTPLPTPPGYVNTSPINPDLWARIPSEHLRYAIKTSVKEVLGDYVWLFRKMKGGGGEATKATEEPGGGAAAASASPTPSPSSGTIRPPLTSEEIREASIRAARRAMDLAKDEGLRERLASLSAEGLSLARDCLDEFLRGYQEGKNEEVRAYIEEQMEKEKEFVQKVKRIRSELDGRIRGEAEDGVGVEEGRRRDGDTTSSSSSPQHR